MVTFKKMSYKTTISLVGHIAPSSHATQWVLS